MRAGRPQIQSPDLPGESPARDRPTKSTHRRLNEGRNVRRRADPDSRAGGPIGRRAPRAACTRTQKAADRPAWARRRPLPFTAGGKRPQTKGGTLSGPPLPGASSAPPRPEPAQRAPWGRRRPSLPQGRPCSTLGAGRLNFRVRYGSGCAPAARAAGPRGALRRGLRGAGRRPGRPGGRTALEEGNALRTVGSGGTIDASRRARPISGARLKASPPLHLRPINQVVSLGPYRREGPSRGRLPA